jgi:hypothetical protein
LCIFGIPITLNNGEHFLIVILLCAQRWRCRIRVVAAFTITAILGR